MIGRNEFATVQVKTTTRNRIGERETTWNDAVLLHGWLDYTGGSSDVAKYNAKVQETTHLFLMDFKSYKILNDSFTWEKSEDSSKIKATSENARIIINGAVYQILLIDNVMMYNEQVEIYLKYVGVGLSV